MKQNIYTVRAYTRVMKFIKREVERYRLEHKAIAEDFRVRAREFYKNNWDDFKYFSSDTPEEHASRATRPCGAPPDWIYCEEGPWARQATLSQARESLATYEHLLTNLTYQTLAHELLCRREYKDWRVRTNAWSHPYTRLAIPLERKVSFLGQLITNNR